MCRTRQISVSREPHSVHGHSKCNPRLFGYGCAATVFQRGQDGNGRGTNWTVERPDQCYFRGWSRSIPTLINDIDHLDAWYDEMALALYLQGLPQTHNPRLTMRKTSVKSQSRDTLQNFWQHASKRSRSSKQGNSRNCHNRGKPVEMQMTKREVGS